MLFVTCRQLAQSRLKACSDLRIQIDKARLREIALYVVIFLYKSRCKITVVSIVSFMIHTAMLLSSIHL